MRRRGALLQLVEQLDRERGKVVDEVQRVLDLVGDPGGQLTEGGHLLRLDQAVLGAAQIAERRLGRGAGAAGFRNSRGVLDRQHRLAGKGLQQGRDGRGERADPAAADHQPADDPVVAQ